MNGLQTLPQWREFFGQPQGAILGVMNMVYPVGKVLALFLVTYICDRWGRRLPIGIGLFLCIAFAILQGLSQGLESFVVARALLGFFTTFLSQPSPILITELAYPTHRGKLTALFNTFFVSIPVSREPTVPSWAMVGDGLLQRLTSWVPQYVGSVLAAWCTYGTFKIESTWSWRIPSILQAGLPAVQIMLFFFLPESPRWLIAHGKREKARQILIKYHAGGDADSPLVEYEMREIESVLLLEAETVSKTSWLELFKTPSNRKRTLIAFIVGWFAQWNGVGIISYYLTLVLNTIGITEVKDQTLINGLLQLFNWAMAAVAALMVDRVGRRTLFLVSTAGMCASYVAWTGLTSHFINSGNEATGRAVVAFIFIYYFFYDIAWTPLLQAYPVEIFPYTLRGRGLSVTLMGTYLGLITGNQVNPIAMQKISWRYYIVFCVILFLLFIVVWFLFPETKGYTLEEIRDLFEGKTEVTSNKLEEAESGPMESAQKGTSDGITHVEKQSR